MPGAHKFGAAISSPSIAGGNADIRLFLKDIVRQIEAETGRNGFGEYGVKHQIQ